MYVLPNYVSLQRIQRALGDRVTVDDYGPQKLYARVWIDGKLIGAYYPGGKVSSADLGGSHLTEAELEAIANA